MPIMAAQERNDARDAAWLLAKIAKDCVGEPEKGPEQVIALNNVFRLLEAFRVNDFFGLEHTPNGDETIEALVPISPFEQNVDDVRVVLESALAATFEGEAKDQAIVRIEDILKRIAYPTLGETSEEERLKANKFFAEVLDRLQLA